MPGTVLTGFFGKLPMTGDFITRGLPAGFRSFWDGFCSAHLAPFHEGWPEGGLRLRLASGGRAAAGVVLPSRDSAGRRYPLALFLMAEHLPGAGPALDLWLDAALAAAHSGTDPEDLWQRLDDIPPPEGSEETGEDAAMMIWQRGVKALPLDAAAPGPGLARFFGPA